MEKQRLEFNRADYEQSIVRIFNKNDIAVGTGFLVAPGYVITCAHVILQALGFGNNHDDFLDYRERRPDKLVTLDFPLHPLGPRIQASVIEWESYSLETGDIAGLKLLECEPNELKPIVIQQCLFATPERHSDVCRVYGFADSTGGWSEEYLFKGSSAGARIQFKKATGDDDTIRGGFSGGPVWNESRSCAIGMIATAQENVGKANAIPKKRLQNVLKKLTAYSLDDLLTQNLECCSDEEKHKLERAIATSMRRSNPNANLGDDNRRSQICDLVDLLPNEGWEEEGRLIQFAVLLAKLDDTPSAVYTNLKTWVAQQGLDFPVLLERITEEMRQQQVSLSTSCEHVMIEVTPDEQNSEQVHVSIWSIAARETYDPLEPPLPEVNNEVVTFDELPRFIYEHLERLGGSPMVHVFVPPKWLDYPIDARKLDDEGFILGSDRPLVMRMNLKSVPKEKSYYDRWNLKWKNVEQMRNREAKDVLLPTVLCSQSQVQLVKVIKKRDAVVLDGIAAVDDLFQLIIRKTALPIALWSRSSQINIEDLDILDSAVHQLPECIRQQRENAEGEEGVLPGHHLSLVWEDPKVIPPTMQFDPEAC